MSAPVADRSFTIAPALAGQTLAAAVRAEFSGISWQKAKDLCTRGKVLVDGVAVVDIAHRVVAGQTVQVKLHAKTPDAPGVNRVKIVYEDAQVVLIDKPSGVSSVPYEKREKGSAMDLIRAEWKRVGKKATVTPLFVVHRIDKETSGLLLFAKTKAAERTVQLQFRAHAVERLYRCLAHGDVRDRTIESALVVDRGDGLRGSTREANKGKRAVTHVRAVEKIGAATLCEVTLETGKTHQIRIHLSESGHPIVGEQVYIRDYTNRGQPILAADRLMLHAATLGFEHPTTGEMIRFEAPLPDDFNAELARVRGTR